MAVTPSNELGEKRICSRKTGSYHSTSTESLWREERSLASPQSAVEKPTYNSCLIVMLTIPDNDELCHRMSTLYRPTQTCESHMVALNLSAGIKLASICINITYKICRLDSCPIRRDGGHRINELQLKNKVNGFIQKLLCHGTA